MSNKLRNKHRFRREWHDSLICDLKKKLNLFDGSTQRKERCIEPVKDKDGNFLFNYEPDIVKKINGQKIIIEVESNADYKIIRDIILSSVVGASQLFIILGKDTNKGEKTKKEKEAIPRHKMLIQYFGDSKKTKLVHTEMISADESNYREKINGMISICNRANLSEHTGR